MARQISRTMRKPTRLTKEDHRVMEKTLLRSLLNNERKTVQKLNPFRFERNRLIRRLAQRGVSQLLLSRISGLSETQIFRIAHKERR